MTEKTKTQMWFSWGTAFWKTCNSPKFGISLLHQCTASIIQFTVIVWKISCGELKMVNLITWIQRWMTSRIFFFKKILNLTFFQIVVVHIGTNNIEDAAEVVANGIEQVITNIRKRLPKAYIVFPVSIFHFFFLIISSVFEFSLASY